MIEKEHIVVRHDLRPGEVRATLSLVSAFQRGKGGPPIDRLERQTKWEIWHTLYGDLYEAVVDLQWEIVACDRTTQLHQSPEVQRAIEELRTKLTNPF
jgi:hypothetical protein